MVFNDYATDEIDEIGNKVGKIASVRLFCEYDMRALAILPTLLLI